MSADSRLLVQAVREGADCEHLFLADVGEQIGWRGGTRRRMFSPVGPDYPATTC